MAGKMMLTNMRNKVCECNDRLHRNWYSVMAAATVGVLNITPTLCAPTMASIFGKILDILYEIAFYVGAMIIVLGVFNWIMAQKDENADGQSRAIKFVIVGIALVALKTLLNPIVSALKY